MIRRLICLMTSIVALVAGLALAAPAALAQTLSFEIKNASASTLTEFYVSPSDVDNWEDNIASAPLEPGGTTEAAVDDGRNACRYDIRSVFADGSEAVDQDVDLCMLGTYTVSEGN